jgi:NDP-sugar pyrophosphorylase family protein
MDIKIRDIVDINHTISKDIFLRYNNFWEIIPNISNYVIELGRSLDKGKYEEIDDNVWISKSAIIDSSSKIMGPCIIDDNTEIRHCAFIRGGVIVGKNCVIGNSCELKNAIVFDNCQIPHFNYMGDSIMGYHSHIGAGVIVTNLKSDKSNVVIKNNGNEIETGLRKMGSIIGDYVEVGCNSTLFPGTIIKQNVNVYPLTRVRGVIPENSIVKSEKVIVRKEER